MKNICTLLLSAILLLNSCSKHKQLSDAYGSFEAVETLVSSETSGRVILCMAEEGLPVDLDQLLFITDSSTLVLQLEQIQAQKELAFTKNNSTQAQIEVQKEQRKTLETDLERLKKMINDGAATQKQIDDVEGKIAITDKQTDQLKTQFATIQAEQKVLIKQIENISLQIGKCSVKSPRKGRILKKYAETGEVVTPGKPLCKIADLEELYIRVYISGKQLPLVKTGQEVEILAEDGQGGVKSYNGTITWISQEAEFTPKVIQTREERVNLVYAVKAMVKNDGSLKIGMPGEMNFSRVKS